MAYDAYGGDLGNDFDYVDLSGVGQGGTTQGLGSGDWRDIWSKFKGYMGEDDNAMGWANMAANLYGGKQAAKASQPVDYNVSRTPPEELGGWAMPQYLMDLMIERTQNPLNPMSGNPFVGAVADRLGVNPSSFSSPFEAMKPKTPPPPPVSSIPGGGS
jgi:hypothetical protein